MMKLLSDIKKTHKHLSDKMVELGLSQKKKEELKKELNVAKKKHKSGMKAKKVVILAAQNTLRDIELYLEKTVNLALRSVFTEPSHFTAKFVERRNTNELDLLFDEDPNIDESHSGGQMDITAFTLRCAFIFKKGLRRLILLDEPFKNVSPEYQEACSNMVKTIIDELDLQVIMVNNMPKLNLSADKLIKL